MTEICNHERAIEDDSPNLSCQSSPETLSHDILGSQVKLSPLDEPEGVPYPSMSEKQSLDSSIALQPTSSMASLNSENHPTLSKLDSEKQSNNSRVIIDQSVVVALLDHGYTDDKFNNYGYLGGKRVLTSRHSDKMICHISHFIPSIRSIESMLAGKGEESAIALKLALEAFSTMGVELLGWYRSDISHKSLKPTHSDLLHQSRFQKAIPYGVGVLISGCKFPKPIDTVHSEIPYELTLFRLSSTYSTSDDVVPYTPIPVTFAVNQQPYTSPELIRQIAGTLKAILVESHVLFEAQRIDCGHMAGRKLFTDSEYDSFLMRFWKTSAIQLKKTVEQEFHSLALKKHHLKTLLTQKIHHLQNLIELDYKDAGSHVRERKLAALEKLIDQTLNVKFEKGSQPGSFNICTWINTDTKANQIPNEEHDSNFKRKPDMPTTGLKRQRKSGHSKNEPNRTINYWPMESTSNGYARSSNQTQFSGKPNSSPHSQSDMTPTQQPHHDFGSFSHPPTPISVEVSPVRGYEQHPHNYNPSVVPPNSDNSQAFLPPASQLPMARVPSYAPPDAPSPTVHCNMDLTSSELSSVSLPSIHGLLEMAATESATLSEPSNSSNGATISPMQSSNTTDHQVFSPHVSSELNAMNEQIPIDTDKAITNHEQSALSMDPQTDKEAEPHPTYEKSQADGKQESLPTSTTKAVSARAGIVPDSVSQTDITLDGVSSERENPLSIETNQSLDDSGHAKNHT